MKAVLTTVGKDQVGIVAGVSQCLAQQGINILDLSQTIMDGYFTMMMVVLVPEDKEFAQVAKTLHDLGEKLNVKINLRNQELYQAMHQI